MSDADETVTTDAGRAVSAAWLCLLLLAALLLTALWLVYTSHQTRQRFAELELLRREEYRLQQQWRQLLVERSALAAHARVEVIARDRLRMRPLEGRDLVAER